MKKIIILILIITSVLTVAQAQTTVRQGGTGLTSIPNGNFLVGSTTLRMLSVTPAQVSSLLGVWNFSTSTIRNLFSALSPLNYNNATGELSVTSGFNIPANASTTAWNSFYDTPSTRITAGTNLSWSGNTLNATAGSSVWGGITGTLSSQTDLQSVLNGKQATLVSGTNIKTVNSTSLLGSGDIAISGVTDGDKGDVTVTGSGATWTIDNLAVNNAKINDVAFLKVTGTPTTLSGYGITDAQPLDGDLTAIAALTGTNNIYYRSAVNTWSPVIIGANLSFSGGTLSGTGGGGGSLTIGSSPIISGTTTNILFNNAGILGEYSPSGTGNIAMTTDPLFSRIFLGTDTAPIIGGSAMHITRNGGSANLILSGTAGGVVFGHRSNGTIVAPTAPINNNILMSMTGGGYNSSAWVSSKGSYTISAAETWTTTSNATKLVFQNTAVGTTTAAQVAEISERGHFGLGTSGAISRFQIAGNISQAYPGVRGFQMSLDTQTFNDTTSTGTVSAINGSTLFGPIFTAATTTTYTDGATLRIVGAAFPSTNVTITNPWSLFVQAGNSHFGGGIRTSSFLQSTNTAGVAFNIFDGGANEMLRLVRATSAVNEVTITNAATAVNPQISATGSDANVGIDFLAKATGVIRFLGNAVRSAQIQLFEDTDDGTNFTAIQVGPQSANITYTLPATIGTSGQFLQNNGAGTLSWQTVSGGAGISRSIVATSTNFTPATTANTDFVYIVDATTANKTITMPSAVSNTNIYTFVNIDLTSTFLLVFNTTSGQTINGNASGVLQLPGGTNAGNVSFVSDGANWWFYSIQ